MAGGLSGCGAYYDGAEYPRSTYVAEAAPPPPQETEVARSEESAASQEQQEEVEIGVDESTYADTDPSAVTEFRSTLEPYGTWMDDAQYGTVWMPSAAVVGSDFAPYVTAGHWTYDTDYVWVSDYSWGWAPFHYGRWVYIAGRGWAWIPGRRYSGAWVTWRVGASGYDYIGWAPLPPSWYWRGGYAYGLYAIPPAPYVFCGRGHLFAPSVSSHIARGPAVAQIGAQTRPYVPASPSVGGPARAVASPAVGPKPDSLGVKNVVAPPKQDTGLDRARAFAVPQTAIANGAAAPARPVRRAVSPTRDDARAIREPRQPNGSDNMLLGPRAPSMSGPRAIESAPRSSESGLASSPPTRLSPPERSSRPLPLYSTPTEPSDSSATRRSPLFDQERRSTQIVPPSSPPFRSASPTFVQPPSRTAPPMQTIQPRISSPPPVRVQPSAPSFQPRVAPPSSPISRPSAPSFSPPPRISSPPPAPRPQTQFRAPSPPSPPRSFGGGGRRK